MARSNKYTSINFNDLFEKKSNKPKPSSSSSPSTNSPPSRNHGGGMLVLTRPSPKPLQTQTQKPKPEPEPEPKPKPEPISLRPLGKTGSSSLSSPSSSSTSLAIPPPTTQERESFKPEPFVPPHLRPGFVGKEERLGQNGQPRNQGVVVRSPNNGYEENGRPKSGGGYERMRRGGGVGESDLGDLMLNRPSSSGNRPGSGGGGGRYGSSNHF